MKNLVIILSTVLFSPVIVVNGQAREKDPRQEAYEKKKEKKAEEFRLQKEELTQLAIDRNLVLEATALYGRHASNVTVGPNNYIMIDSADFVLQTSSPNQIGQNGMGGVTIRGAVTSYNVKEGVGKKPTTVTAQISTFGLGNATLTMRLHDSKNSQATFMTVAGQTITLSGPVTSVEESNVFQGMRLY